MYSMLVILGQKAEGRCSSGDTKDTIIVLFEFLFQDNGATVASGYFVNLKSAALVQTPLVNCGRGSFMWKFCELSTRTWMP